MHGRRSRSPSVSSRTPAGRGFTLVELLVVMVVIAILSAIAISRIAGRQPYEAYGYIQELAAAARYAQKVAIASGCPVRLRFEDASGYRLDQANEVGAAGCGGFGGNVVNPGTGQAPYVGTTPAGVVLTAGGGFPAARIFDAQGGISPDTDLLLQIGPGPRTLLIRHGGGQVVVQ